MFFAWRLIYAGPGFDLDFLHFCIVRQGEMDMSMQLKVGIAQEERSHFEENGMKRRSIALLAAIAATSVLAMPTATQAGQGILIRCPTSTVLDVPPSALPQGWTSRHAATVYFSRAQVGSLPNYPAFTLVCEFSGRDGRSGPSVELTQPVPGGMTCSVDAGIATQFNCYPADPSRGIKAPAQNL